MCGPVERTTDKSYTVTARAARLAIRAARSCASSRSSGGASGCQSHEHGCHTEPSPHPPRLTTYLLPPNRSGGPFLPLESRSGIEADAEKPQAPPNHLEPRPPGATPVM